MGGELGMGGQGVVDGSVVEDGGGWGLRGGWGVTLFCPLRLRTPVLSRRRSTHKPDVRYAF